MLTVNWIEVNWLKIGGLTQDRNHVMVVMLWLRVLWVEVLTTFRKTGHH